MMEDPLKYAQEKFADHVAVYCDYGNVATLTWAKPGRRDYSMRYVFDTVGHTMTISGDLGYAVVCPTCKVDLKNCADAFRNSIDYFAEKIKAASNRYVYDDSLAREELRERLLSDNLTRKQKAEREALIDDIMEDFDMGQDGVKVLDVETSNKLNRIDSDAWEWIGTIGRRYHLRVYLWMYGLQMAWEQVKSKNQPEIHVTLAMSTSHISKESQDYLNDCVDGGYGLTVFRKEDCTGDYGWWVFCDSDSDAISAAPADIQQCVLFAQKFGACWIMFDSAATEYDELPVYEDSNSAMTKAKYVSVWDGGIRIESSCDVNHKTRQVVNIQVREDVDGLDHLEGEYVVFDEVEHPVWDHEPTDDYEWGELRRAHAYWRD